MKNRYTIPLYKLNYGAEEKSALIKTLNSKWISMGPNVQALENKFKEHLGCNHAVALSNCTAALHIALSLLGVGKGDEVIVPALTFIATVNAVRYVGATPVFADITSCHNFSIDPEEIRKKITKSTKAIIVMHYAGFACDLGNILDIAHKKGLYVIEDAAHALDSSYKNRKLGTFGDFGCFSLYSNKNITCAEGGIIVTRNKKMADRAKLLRSHGMTTNSFQRYSGSFNSYNVVDLGYNYRMDDLRASLAIAQMDKLVADTDRRVDLRNYYIKCLKNINELLIPYTDSNYRSSNYIFPVILRNGNSFKRDKIREKLSSYGIETSVHYPAIHKFDIFRNMKIILPKTEYVCSNEFSLPLFYSLKKSEIRYIASSIKKVLLHEKK